MSCVNDFQPGHVNQITNTAQLGTEFVYDDLNYSAEGPVRTKYSNEKVYAILVVNRAGATLSPGELVTWKTSEEGPGQAIGAVGADDVETCGVVDPWLTADVADDDFFLLFVKGPTKVAYDGSATISVGSKLGSAGSGLVDVHVAETDNPHALFGVALEAKSSGSANDLFRARVNFHN